MSDVIIPPGHARSHPNLRGFLENESDRLGVPIRVIDGGGAQLQPDIADSAWMGTDALTVTLQQCREHGVTLVFWGSISHMGGAYTTATMPPEFFEDELDTEYRRIADTMRFEEGELEAEPIHLGEDGRQRALVGEIGPRVVALHVNPRWASYPERARFDWLSESFDRAVNPELLAEARERQLTRAREQFIEASRQRGDEVEEIRERIASQEVAYADAQASVQTYRRQLADAQQLLDSILARRENDEGDVFEREWEALLRHNHVTDVRWSRDRLIVYTDELDITHPDTGETATLGSFALLVTPGQHIRVKNLTHRRGTYDHPHVNRGRVCAGDLAGTLDELIHRQQIATAVNMVISLLHRVTPEDAWGRHIEWWFGSEESPEPVAQTV